MPAEKPVVIVMVEDDNAPSEVMAAITQALCNYAIDIGADPVEVLQAATRAARCMRDGSAAPYGPVTINAPGGQG